MFISHRQVRRLSRCDCRLSPRARDDTIFHLHICVVVAVAQLWPGDSQSASRAPVPSCSAGRTPRCSGAWPRGGRRWAGSRRRGRTCGTSGPTWARSQSGGSGSQVSRAWPGRRVNQGQGSSSRRFKLGTQPQKNVHLSRYRASSRAGSEFIGQRT